MAAPCKGRIVSIKAAAQGTLAGSDTVLTVAINGTNITGGTITLTAGAAGNAYETDLTDLSTNLVREGDKIRFTSNGGSNDGTVYGGYQGSLERDSADGLQGRLLVLALGTPVNEIECHRRSLEPMSPIINRPNAIGFRKLIHECLNKRIGHFAGFGIAPICGLDQS